jgi:hypothetical protein
MYLLCFPCLSLSLSLSLILYTYIRIHLSLAPPTPLADAPSSAARHDLAAFSLFFLFYSRGALLFSLSATVTTFVRPRVNDARRDPRSWDARIKFYAVAFFLLSLALFLARSANARRAFLRIYWPCALLCAHVRGKKLSRASSSRSSRSSRSLNTRTCLIGRSSI